MVKSALGVSLVSVVILLPFCINNFVHGRIVGGILTLIVTMLCSYNSWLGWQGKYALNLNLFGIIPAITLGIVNATITLGVLGSYWAYLGVFAIYFILPLQPAKYANVIFLLAVITAAWGALETVVYLRFSAVLIGVSLFIFISNREISKSHHLLKKQSVTDVLTGVYNRAKLVGCLEDAITAHEREGTNSTLCVIDIDHFKSVNDNFGHDVGDKVLVELCQFIKSMTSNTDTLFRIGGEEFLILMSDTDADVGAKTADALRCLVQDLPLIENHTITLSIGVTGIGPGYNWKEWMKLSDEKLYTAKKNGRNQIVM